MDSPERHGFPGFGEPVQRYYPWKSSPRYGWQWSRKYVMFAAGARLTNREIRMMAFVNQITDKQSWVDDVFDNSIVDGWQKEVDSMPADKCEGLLGDVFFSKDMFEFCIEELRVKAIQAKTTGIVDVLDAEAAVAKSDSIVPTSLAEALKANAKPLEDFHTATTAWKSKPDKTVLNLIDPSIFPLKFSKTKALPYGYVPLHHCASVAGKGEYTDWYLPDIPVTNLYLGTKVYGVIRGFPCLLAVLVEIRSKVDCS
ncbi:hypothetical protein F5B19DRAFT_502834 [Rostrohypoxylon terebratum]|nr:hypothetical protein F5B19DRAFT_502834 [Rostrohypoxylon terebratum]